MHIYEACDILGVHPNDPDLQGSAHRAYRQLAKNLHPDKTGNPETSEEFSRATDAYNAVNEFLKLDTQTQQPTMPRGNSGIIFHVNGGQQVSQSVDRFGNVTVTIRFG